MTKREEPTATEVQKLHDVYVKRLKGLFDRYKAEHSQFPDAELQIK